MNYYKELWSEQVIFQDQQTLAYKLKTIEQRLDITGKDAKDVPLVIQMRKDIYGVIDVDKSPFDFQIEILKMELNISEKEWNEMTLQDKGKMLAAKQVQSNFEIIAKYEHALDANKKKESKPISRKNGKH